MVVSNTKVLNVVVCVVVSEETLVEVVYHKCQLDVKDVISIDLHSRY